MTEIFSNADIKGPVTLGAADMLFGQVSDCALHGISLVSTNVKHIFINGYEMGKLYKLMFATEVKKYKVKSF